MNEKETFSWYTLFLGIVIGIVGILFVTTYYPTSEESTVTYITAPPGTPASGDTYTTTTTDTTTNVYESEATTTLQRADLREVALPYLVAFPNFQTLCLTGGGTYHETHDWVGCEGVGTPDCNTGAIIAARTQCLSVGGDFMCSPTDLYCRYMN